MRYKFIAIEGNIGAGKTTLASKLAHAYKGKLILEEFENNPFLPKFYAEPAQYAFALELSFLAERFHQLNEEFKRGNYLRVSDYYFNKTLIFAQANLNTEEFDVFRKIYDVMIHQLAKPDLVVFLNPVTQKLRENISSRGRKYEQDIELSYLEKIQHSYSVYLENQNELAVLMLNLESSKYVNSLSDFAFLDKLLQKDYPNGITTVSI